MNEQIEQIRNSSLSLAKKREETLKCVDHREETASKIVRMKKLRGKMASASLLSLYHWIFHRRSN